jgi:hypothetical protein
MQDGSPNDTLSTTGSFTGVANSTLAVDTFLGPPGSTSDRLAVGGNVSGNTLVKVSDVNTGPGAFNPTGITVVTVQGTGSNNFKVDPTSPNYLNFGPLGAINKGFFIDPLLYVPGGTGGLPNAYKFFGLPGPFAFNMPVAHTGAQSIFQETADVWEDRQDEVRSCMRHGLIAAGLGAGGSVDLAGLMPGDPAGVIPGSPAGAMPVKAVGPPPTEMRRRHLDQAGGELLNADRHRRSRRCSWAAIHRPELRQQLPPGDRRRHERLRLRQQRAHLAV